ncbi:MAG: nucleotidyltransferase domain-containing protein [Oscillospiraceae bacterium]|nr:nucleotidyltransferase domain-containing protein [Oscillospiraceae bacterium]
MNELSPQIQAELEIIKHCILETVPAEAIYLFGSYAYGTPREDSDLDIFVVIPDSVATNPLEVSADIMGRVYRNVDRPIDMLVGRSEIFHRRKNGPTLQRHIVQQGRQLYGY